MQNAESEVRDSMLINIFTILIQKINRDNKIHYCNDHAMEKAKIIEDKLYNNCKENAINWSELYNNIDINALIEHVEAKTLKCIY